MTKNELIALLNTAREEDLKKLFTRAYDTKLRYVGNRVFFRGIIELSNYCSRNCYYCGIRRDNNHIKRYEMSIEEAVDSALWAYRQRYGSVVIQCGERRDHNFIEKISTILRTIKVKTSGKLGITLSLGEQSREVYSEWFKAGAHRYLLRIETTDGSLFRKCHPADHSFEERLACLKMLRDIGYQVGTGVLIGLPGQTIESLADDIIFLDELDVDMIGMGPYVIHKDTPFNRYTGAIDHHKNLELALKMIAVTRIYLRDVNIASTTALQAIDASGRELGLKAGANIIMPVITDVKYRSSYQLYNGKPSLDENAEQVRDKLEEKIKAIGEEIGYGEWGDSPHYKQRIKRPDSRLSSSPQNDD